MINAEEVSKRDIVITLKEKENQQYPFQFINENLSFYDPLGYTTMHLNGESGWQYKNILKITKEQLRAKEILINHYESILPSVNFQDVIQNNPMPLDIARLIDLDTELIDQDNFEILNTKKCKYVTAREFYAYKLQDRSGKLKNRSFKYFFF